jgi:hypothetical protein
MTFRTTAKERRKTTAKFPPKTNVRAVKKKRRLVEELSLATSRQAQAKPIQQPRAVNIMARADVYAM